MKRLSMFGWLVLLLVTPAHALELKAVPIVTPKRLELLKEYSNEHYGVDSYELKNPKIIVIHYTVTPTLESCLTMFKGDYIADYRQDIKGHGRVNVGVHFLVDRNGDAYTLLPTNVIGRHVIGLNHVSIGIENVAADAARLTVEQLETNVELVRMLTGQFNSLEYLIGHHEYLKKDLPHFRLFRELDKKYRPTIKQDPGDRFMADLRARLKLVNIELKK